MEGGFRGNMMTRHGNFWESTARDRYLKSPIVERRRAMLSMQHGGANVGVRVVEFGLVVTPTDPIFGVSPDGIVECFADLNGAEVVLDQRALEIKCPFHRSLLQASLQMHASKCTSIVAILVHVIHDNIRSHAKPKPDDGLWFLCFCRIARVPVSVAPVSQCRTRVARYLPVNKHARLCRAPKMLITCTAKDQASSYFACILMCTVEWHNVSTFA